MKGPKSLDGIISYLTEKHGGNVHETRVVTISSKSVLMEGPRHAPLNVANLTSILNFCSKNAPGQWICWDFQDMRIPLSRYSIQTGDKLKTWVLEGSLNGENWTEIDHQPDNQDFANGLNTASFAVSNRAEFRFIRLTQTGKRHDGNHWLSLAAVEMFGALYE
jgi:hypothetical protein